MSSTTATITIFDQLSVEEKFVLLIAASSVCARRGMTEPPSGTELVAMVREAWNASGASAEMLRDPEATSELLWNAFKKLPR